jgi:methyl-accepting chemotaxis protein
MRITITARIALLVGACVIVIMAGIFFIVSTNVKKTIETLIADASGRQLGARSDQIDEIIKSYQRLLKSVSSQDALVDRSNDEMEAEADDARLLKARADLNFILIIIMTAGVIIAVGAAVFIGGVISKPIRNVALTLKDISEGEGDLTKQVDISRRDEIGDLAKYFNSTLEKIKYLVVTIKQQAVSLFDIGSKLSANMSETASAINQITANIQSIKGRVINQSASVTQTNATMEQMTVNIDKLNANVEQQNTSVVQSSSAIEEMLANIQSVANTLVKNSDNVKNLMEASDIGRTGLQDVASDIQEIAKESEGLLEINAVMENIASQTNLLSMNAAVNDANIISSENKNSIDTLVKEVSKFKVD